MELHRQPGRRCKYRFPFWKFIGWERSVSGRTEIESASSVRLADAVTRLNAKIHPRLSRGCKVRFSWGHIIDHRPGERGATRESMDVEPGDKQPGQPGDKSIGDAEGPRFLGKLRKLVQRRPKAKIRGNPEISTMAKPDGARTGVTRGTESAGAGRCRLQGNLEN